MVLINTSCNRFCKLKKKKKNLKLMKSYLKWIVMKRLNGFVMLSIKYMLVKPKPFFKKTISNYISKSKKIMV